MKPKTIMPLFILICGCVLFLPACATKTFKPLAPGGLAVETAPTFASVEIVQTTARQEGESVIVAGHLQRKMVRGREIPKGHVDIAIIDGQGKTIHKISTGISPEIVPRLPGAKSSFRAQIPMKVPPGGKVTVTFQ